MVSGFIDIPPYVTMVLPGARLLATDVEEAPPTQFRPSFGLGMSAEAASAQHHSIRGPNLARSDRVLTSSEQRNKFHGQPSAGRRLQHHRLVACIAQNLAKSDRVFDF